jgi:polygalacturonase
MLRLILPLFLFATCATAALAAEPQLPSIPDRVFKVSDHGAVSDDHTDNAKAIQASIDAAAAAGGGVVEISEGHFLSGPLHLADSIRLQLDKDAILQMLPIDRYPGGTKNPADLISGAKLHDIAIGGPGTIDGQGAAWWPLVKKEESISRPRMIHLSGCHRVLIENILLQNSPMFHIAIGGKDTTDVTVRGVTIRAPASTDPQLPSHNTDACDVSGQHILVRDCDVSVGDDDFTCGGGTSDVLITHCKYGYGHGVSIGSYTNPEVSNITVEDCTFNNTECGIRIKTDRDRGGNVHHMVYRNLQMTNVGIPILIYAAYNAKKPEYRKLNNLTAEMAASYPPAEKGPRTPVYNDITFSNISATAAPGSRAGLIWGLPESPVTNLILENVNITAEKPFGIYSANGVQLIHCNIVTQDGVNKISSSNAQISVQP